MGDVVHVAVGVIQNAHGDICIAKRPAGKHLEGFWEFPGGKVEPSESVQSALSRELEEELGLIPISTHPLVEIQHEYTTKTVLLDVHWVTRFSGEAKGKEGQEIKWVPVSDLSQYEFPEANKAIISAILAEN